MTGVMRFTYSSLPKPSKSVQLLSEKLQLKSSLTRFIYCILELDASIGRDRLGGKVRF